MVGYYFEYFPMCLNALTQRMIVSVFYLLIIRNTYGIKLKLNFPHARK